MKELMKKFLRTNEYFFYSFAIFPFSWDTIASDEESRDDLCIFRVRIPCYFQGFFYFLSANICVLFSKIRIYDDFTFFVNEFFDNKVCCCSSISKVAAKNIVKNLIFECFSKSK